MIGWRFVILALIALLGFPSLGDADASVVDVPARGSLRRLGTSCNRVNFEEADRTFPLVVSLPVMGGLLLLSCFFTTLTLGLMGMDTVGLEIVAKGDDEALARCAAKICTVRENGNQLLVTLLLGNVTSNAAFAILAADALTIYYGLAASVVTILLVGEVLPQAFCTRYTLQVGARMVPAASMAIMLFYIVTKPIAIALHWVLGREMGAVRSRTDLIEKLQAFSDERERAVMAADEIATKVAEGALQFRNRTVKDVMTPLEDAYMLSASTRLGYTTIREIFETGFTRIPVYGQHKNEFKGLLVTKDLMLADPEDEMKVGDFISVFDRKVETFYQETRLVDVLNKFKKGGTHMGLVRSVNTDVDTDPHFELRGVVTLEDVLEEILQDEIVDETDVYKDVDNQVKVLDGRESRQLDLSVFNPMWKTRVEPLSPEEVQTIASHLCRVVFAPGTDLTLSFQAVAWLVMRCGVQNRVRVTEPGVSDIREQDIIYETAKESDKCIVIVQGRVGIRAGKDGFRSEAGAFSVLSRDALSPGCKYVSDYRAYVMTDQVRLVSISKVNFLEALILDRDKAKLSNAHISLAGEVVGKPAQKQQTSTLWEPADEHEGRHGDRKYSFSEKMLQTLPSTPFRQNDPMRHKMRPKSVERI